MEAPQQAETYSDMKDTALWHIYDLSRIRAYIWHGDQDWAARSAGVSRGRSSAYLSGQRSPTQARTKLLWRLLLAKSLNNKSYAAAVALHNKPVSSKALRAARPELLPHDHFLLGQFLGVSCTQVRSVVFRSRKVIPEDMQDIATAAVLRADYNKILLQQISPWLSKKHDVTL